MQRRLVEAGRVPDVEVDGPQRQRDQWVGEELQPVDGPDAQDRREDRPGEPEDEQQRGDVAEQQVLAHVGDEQLLGEIVERADEGHEHDHEAAVEADLPPPRRRPPLAAQRPHARAVQPSDRRRGRSCGRIRSTGLQATRRRREYGAGGDLVSVLRSLGPANRGDEGGWGSTAAWSPGRSGAPANGGDEGGWARAPALSPGRSRAPTDGVGGGGGVRPPLGPQAAPGPGERRRRRRVGSSALAVPSAARARQRRAAAAGVGFDRRRVPRAAPGRRRTAATKEGWF